MGRGAGGKIYDTLGGRYLLRFGFVLARSGLGFLNATFGVGKFAILCALKLGPAKKLGGEWWWGPSARAFMELTLLHLNAPCWGKNPQSRLAAAVPREP